jgi:hypothetical protein
VVDLEVEPNSVDRVGVHDCRRDFADVVPKVDGLSQTFANSNWVPAYAGPQSLILATSTGGAAPTVFTYVLPSDPGAWSGSTGTMTWNAGSHVVTVPITTTVALAVGTQITLSGMNASWNPAGAGGGVPFTVAVYPWFGARSR